MDETDLDDLEVGRDDDEKVTGVCDAPGTGREAVSGQLGEDLERGVTSPAVTTTGGGSVERPSPTSAPERCCAEKRVGVHARRDVK